MLAQLDADSRPFSALGDLIYDSGDNPAVNTQLPSSLSTNMQTAEIFVVSLGQTAAAFDMGAGGLAMYYFGGYSASGAGTANWLDGSPRTIRSNFVLPTNQPAVHGIRGNGASSIIMFCNGVDFAAIGASTPTGTGGEIGGRAGAATFDWKGTINRVLIFATNLTTANRAKVYAKLRNAYRIKPWTKQVIACGDSITAGYNSVGNVVSDGWTSVDRTWSYPHFLAANRPELKIINHGVTAITIATMITNDTTSVDVLKDTTNFTENVCVVWGGTNDLIGGASVATVEGSITSYCNARNSAGFRTIFIPIMDRGGFSAGNRTDMATINSWLGTQVGTLFTDLVTLPTELAGTSPWSTYSTFWDADNTHLSKLGYQAIAKALANVI